MAGQYTAQEQTIGEMLAFTSVPLKVPTWQRSYSWRTQEVGTFWEDLVRFSERYPGDNVNGKEYFLGSVVMVDRTTYLEVLDGQQRLATATLLIAALRDVAADYDAEAARDIANDYIAKKNRATDATEFKLRLNNYDWKFFRNEVQVYDANTPKQEFKSHRLIAKARKLLLDRVRERYDASGGGKKGYQEIQRLLKVLVNHVSVVEVRSRDEDSAAAVFETLNDRGIGLSTPDLLRNFLLLRAKNDAERDEIVDLWEEVFTLGGDGTNVEDFLRHYWISTHGDVKAKALYREIKADIEDQDTRSLTLSKSLAKSADDYELLRGADVSDRQLRLALEAVQALTAKVLMPPLLSARAVGNQSQQVDLAQLLVAVFVRHTLIGGLAGSELESVAFELAVRLRKKKDFVAAQRQLRDFAPSDAAFKRAFEKAEVTRIKSARYLLTAVEHHFRRTGEVRVEDPSMVHVEHVYPQSPKKGAKWKSHDDAVNRIGNLTLLGKRMNQSIRNTNFKTKKQNAYKNSDIKITARLMSYSKWSEAEIDDRQAWLARAAVKVWVV
jgi:uncharacterized protein with ParB-like and HNH nuclease domain